MGRFDARDRWICVRWKISVCVSGGGGEKDFHLL